MKRKLTLERIHEENFERKLFEKIGMRHPLETKQHENIIFKKGIILEVSNNSNKRITPINNNQILKKTLQNS